MINNNIGKITWRSPKNGENHGTQKVYAVHGIDLKANTQFMLCAQILKMLKVLKVRLPLAKRPSTLNTHLRFMFIVIPMNRIQVKDF